MVKNKNLLIESGELEDDFNNHFLSHFGFYDKNLSEYEYGKYHNRWSLEMPKGVAVLMNDKGLTAFPVEGYHVKLVLEGKVYELREIR